jgi:hypothetical protein
MSGAMPPLPQYAFMAWCTGKTLPLPGIENGPSRWEIDLWRSRTMTQHVQMYFIGMKINIALIMIKDAAWWFELLPHVRKKPSKLLQNKSAIILIGAGKLWAFPDTTVAFQPIMTEREIPFEYIRNIPQMYNAWRTTVCRGSGHDTRVYPKVSGLAAWSENCKWYVSLPLDAVVSLFYESV